MFLYIRPFLINTLSQYVVIVAITSLMIIDRMLFLHLDRKAGTLNAPTTWNSVKLHINTALTFLKIICLNLRNLLTSFPLLLCDLGLSNIVAKDGCAILGGRKLVLMYLWEIILSALFFMVTIPQVTFGVSATKYPL